MMDVGVVLYTLLLDERVLCGFLCSEGGPESLKNALERDLEVHVLHASNPFTLGSLTHLQPHPL